MNNKPTYEELVKRVKELEVDRDLATQILETVNTSVERVDLIKRVLLLIKEQTDLEAVGVRLRQDEDFPYYETSGFPTEFLEGERYLCARNQAGELIRDSNGNPYLACMCGNVLSGRVDPSLSFFTENGSFWTNSTTELLASTTEEDRQSHTRNRCHGEGYESVALIPLRTDNETVGLLQFNDRRKGRFTHEMIRFFEKVGSGIGISFERMHREEALLQEQERLKDALSRIKTLSGLLPICATCKKIRDDKGYWSQIESYIRRHSEAEFSHSICPDCAKRDYPDLDIYD